jgi:N-methylhydantoinase B
VEVLETKYPLQIRRYVLEADSGGPGEHRGGLGVIKDSVPTDDSSRVSLWFERNVTPPWGLAGGEAGRPARVVVGAGTPEEQVLMKVNHRPLSAGLLVSARTGGGGGFGPPWRRPVESVLDDVLDGYVSIAGAEGDYGLRFAGDALRIDVAATRTARQAMAAERSSAGGGLP